MPGGPPGLQNRWAASRRRRVRFPSASAFSFRSTPVSVRARRLDGRGSRWPLRSRLWTRAVMCPGLTSCSPTLVWSRRGSCLARHWSRRRWPAPRNWPAPGPSARRASPTRRRPALPPTAATLTPVINATGVVVHTNLGRAPLSAAARDAVQAAAGCTDVEFDLASGKRGRRGAGALDALARAVPAAGAVHVVNNNAAALVAGGHRAGRRARDHRQPRRADRDRRRIPAS